MDKPMLTLKTSPKPEPAKPAPAPQQEKKPPRPEPGEMMFVAALHEHRPLAFEFLDREILEAVPVMWGTYAYEVRTAEGEKLIIFKHAIRTMRKIKPPAEG